MKEKVLESSYFNKAEAVIRQTLSVNNNNNNSNSNKSKSSKNSASKLVTLVATSASASSNKEEFASTLNALGDSGKVDVRLSKKSNLKRTSPKLDILLDEDADLAAQNQIQASKKVLPPLSNFANSNASHSLTSPHIHIDPDDENAIINEECDEVNELNENQLKSFKMPSSSQNSKHGGS